MWPQAEGGWLLLSAGSGSGSQGELQTEPQPGLERGHVLGTGSQKRRSEWRPESQGAEAETALLMTLHKGRR